MNDTRSYHPSTHTDWARKTSATRKISEIFLEFRGIEKGAVHNAYTEKLDQLTEFFCIIGNLKYIRYYNASIVSLGGFEMPHSEDLKKRSFERSFGAWRGNRTPTSLQKPDFESSASTSSAIQAWIVLMCHMHKVDMDTAVVQNFMNFSCIFPKNVFVFS